MTPRPDMRQIGDLWTPVNSPAPRVPLIFWLLAGAAVSACGFAWVLA
jgi:hypothetical protein